MGIDNLLSRLRMLLWRCAGFAGGIDRRASIHYSVDVCRARAQQLVIQRDVVINKHTWINIPREADPGREILRISAGTGIGRNNVISAKNRIEIGVNCVTAPQVLIMDHCHEFRNIDTPIRHQGTTPGGTIIIEPGCWIGFGAVIICNRGVLRIGRNSVVGANAVVTSSVPERTVVVGIPARPVRRFDAERDCWMRFDRAASATTAVE